VVEEEARKLGCRNWLTAPHGRGRLRRPPPTQECKPIIIVIITNIEFLTSQFWVENIHLSWDAVIKRIKLGVLICSLKSFLQLNMCQELQIFAAVYMYWGAG